MPNLLKDSELKDIYEKVEAGERTNEEDALRCLKSNDLAILGYMADKVRERVSGNQVYYSTYLNINYTNICKNACKLCAFYRTDGESDAYIKSIEEIGFRVKEALGKSDIEEVHIVGGINEKLPFTYYLEMIQKIKEMGPDLFIKAFTAVEIDQLAKVSNQNYETVLSQLKNAGLDGLPGGGAEIFSQKIRQLICPHKIKANEWLKVHRIAHQMKLRSNATMLYGHFESPEDIISHLKQLRGLQDETGGFKAFIPLPFHAKGTQFEDKFSETDGVLDVKIFTTSRLYLDNFPHIKAHWSSLGLKFSQSLLSYGVDDLGGTAQEEKIFHDAGAKTPVHLDESSLRLLIEEIGREPIHINSSYE